MKKVLFIGSYMLDGKFAPIFCKVEFADERLSISGVIAPMSNGDARGGCGQIDMDFEHRNKKDNDTRYNTSLIKADDIRFDLGWNKELWFDFLDVWKKYHLNDMHAGCEHQRALGFEREPYEKNEGKKCLECDYVYGTAWKSERVPVKVIEFLQSLPESTRKPAWV